MTHRQDDYLVVFSLYACPPVALTILASISVGLLSETSFTKQGKRNLRRVRVSRVPSRWAVTCVDMNIAKDGRFVCYGPAGGGYGNPLERDPAKVADDVLDEVISVETALKDYGVVVSTKGVVDRVATEKARAGSQG